MSPEKEEFRSWLEKDVTRWFFQQLLEQFDANNKIYYANADENVGVYKGHQEVMRYIRNPEDLL